jgi:hypothetical protein
MSATGGRLGLLTDIMGKFGGKRASVLAAMADADPNIARAVDAALASDTPNRAVAQLMADKNIGKALEAALLADARRAAQPATTDQVMEGLGFERPRTNEQIVRDAVLGEGPYGESMMPGFGEPSQASVERIHNELLSLPDSRSDSLGALAERMGQSGPRPLYTEVVSNARPQYSFDLPNNTSPAFQISDLTPSQRSAMNPRRPAEPDLMDAVRANFENQAAGMDADINSLSADISRPAPDFNMTAMDESAPLVRLAGGRAPAPEAPRPAVEAPGPLRRAEQLAGGAADEQAAMDRLARAVDADAARRRVPRDGDFRLDAPQRSNRAKNAAMAAAAAGGGVAALKLGTDLMFPGDSSLGSADMEPEPYRPVPNVMRPPRTTADLAAEQNPPPSVMTQEPEVVDYSSMARAKIRQANEIQRREGRVTPESAALTREADALYRRSADERSAGRGQPIMPSEQANAQTSAVRAEGQRQIRDNPGEDHHSQARRLMGRMNSGEFRSPAEYSAAKREVDRLFALGDAQRNSRR